MTKAASSSISARKDMQHNMLKLFVIFFSVVCLLCIVHTGNAHAKKLNIGYIEYPPYYFTNSQNVPDGKLIKFTTEIMTKAGIDFAYRKLPSQRVLKSIKRRQYIASIGWFKTKQRETYANFSLPIYTNHPVGALINKKTADRFTSFKTLKKIMQSDKFTLGLIAGHSEGGYIDSLTKAYPHKIQFITGRQTQLVKMLHASRLDLVLLPQEEVSTIVKDAGLYMQDFSFLELSDVPAGNKRYLMFSKAVEPEIIEKINAAITELKAETTQPAQ